MKKMQTLTVNGNAYQISDAEAVSFAAPQGLTPEQQQQAKENLGLGGQYELIEDVTLTEDVTSFYRNTDPDGVGYDFRGARILVHVPACPTAPSYNQMIFSLSGRKTSSMIYHQTNYAVATDAKTVYLSARNDAGFMDYYAGIATGNNVGTMQMRPYGISTPWENVISVYLVMNPGDVKIPAGTQIQIYGIRG